MIIRLGELVSSKFKASLHDSGVLDLTPANIFSNFDIFDTMQL